MNVEWLLLIAWSASIWLWLRRPTVRRAIPCGFFTLLVAAIAIPGAVPARTNAMRAACVANLRAIAHAKAQWAKEKSKQPTDTPTDADVYGETKALSHKP